jgi:phosphonate transport system permease protein
MLFGVVPQVMPRVVGLTIYRWDINIRHSTIVGIVGAGGIGSTLLNSFDKYDYDFFLTIVLAIIAIVMVGEFVSTYIRGRIQ